MGKSQSRLQAPSEEIGHHAPHQEVVYVSAPHLSRVIYIGAVNDEGIREEAPLETPATVQQVSVDKSLPSVAPISLMKDTLEIEPIEDDQFLLKFRYTANEKCTVSFLFCQDHQGLANGIPKFSEPLFSIPDIELEIGKDIQFSLDKSRVKKMKSCTLQRCAFTEKRNLVPILLTMRPVSKDYCLYTMAGLKFNELKRNWNIIVTKQRVKHGDFGYQIQEIYGLEQSVLSKSQAFDSQKQCVICLTMPNNTFVMPCRHMCLCFPCATELVDSQPNCPICRCPISKIVQVHEGDQ